MDDFKTQLEELAGQVDNITVVKKIATNSEASSFLFRHRVLLSVRLLLQHNLGLEGGLNFRWQYTGLDTTSIIVSSFGLVYL